jgi:hypothetical protein
VTKKKIKKRKKIKFHSFYFPFICLKKKKKITLFLLSSGNTYTTGHTGGTNSTHMGYSELQGERRSGVWSLCNTAILFVFTLLSLNFSSPCLFSPPRKAFFPNAACYHKCQGLMYCALCPPSGSPFPVLQNCRPRLDLFPLQNSSGG